VSSKRSVRQQGSLHFSSVQTTCARLQMHWIAAYSASTRCSCIDVPTNTLPATPPASRLCGCSMIVVDKIRSCLGKLTEVLARQRYDEIHPPGKHKYKITQDSSHSDTMSRQSGRNLVILAHSTQVGLTRSPAGQLVSPASATGLTSIGRL
jgi:hypothetical protein